MAAIALGSDQLVLLADGAGVHRDVVCDVVQHEDLLRGLEPQAALAIVSPLCWRLRLGADGQ